MLKTMQLSKVDYRQGFHQYYNLEAWKKVAFPEKCPKVKILIIIQIHIK